MRSRKLLIWLVLAIGVAFLLPTIGRRFASFDWVLFRQTFANVKWSWIIASWVMALTTYAGRVIRWRVMLAPQRPNSDFWGMFKATVIGFTAVVLFGRPGEIVRPYLIARQERVSVGSQMAAWFLERVYDLLMVLVIFGFSLATFEPPEAALTKGMQWVFHTGGKVVLGLGAGCLICLLAAHWISLERLRYLVAHLPLPAVARRKLESLLQSLYEGFESCQSLTAVAKLASYTFLEWLIIIGCYLCIFRAFPFTEKFGMLDVFVFLGFVSFGSIVQLPGIGGGVQVVAAAVLNELFQLPLEQATGLAIAIWLITWVSIIPFGLFLAMRQGLEWRSLKHIDEKAVE